MTKKAYDIAVKGSIKKIKGKLYQEHITPVEYIFKKLEKLGKAGGITPQSIKACMVQNKLVLLDASEKKKLDGNKFSRDDFKCLQDVIQKTQTKFVDAKSELSEAEELIGRSSKCDGSGLYRICKLLASGVHFCDVNGKECSGKRLALLLVKDFKKYTTA